MALVSPLFTTTSTLFNSASMTERAYPAPSELFSGTLNLMMSASSYGVGGQTDIVDILSGNIQTSGSFLFHSGTAIQFGITVVETGSIMHQSWLGTAIQLGIVDQAIPEPHSHVEIDSENPNSLEGANLVEWNVFPAPTTVITPLKQRDLTRYHKAYSFTRNHPVRIRLIKR
jgi:hypothetical protein